MGVFDEIYIPCPKCGFVIYEQSKSAPCPQLNKFYVAYRPDGEIFIRAWESCFEGHWKDYDPILDGYCALSGLLSEKYICDKCQYEFKLTVKYYIQPPPTEGSDE